MTKKTCPGATAIATGAGTKSDTDAEFCITSDFDSQDLAPVWRWLLRRFGFAGATVSVVADLAGFRAEVAA